MLIEIKGVQFVNKGAELMLHATLQQIQQRWPQADIVLAPGANSPYKARALLGAYQKLPLHKGRWQCHGIGNFLSGRIRNWLKSRLGLVTEADIDVVLDASGFAYGDQWPKASVKLLCAEIKRYASKGKKYILLPQAFGPFSRAEDIALLKDALPNAALICARDTQSFQYIDAILPKAKNLVCFPDFTNLVSPVLLEDFQQGQRKVLFIPNSNMLSTKNSQQAWIDSYIPTLLNLMEIATKAGYTPVLLNHEGEGDAKLCHELVRLSNMDYQIITEPNPLKVKGIIGASAGVVCSRFHGCVSALAQGVPCIGTSWSHKYEELFSDYGCLTSLLNANSSSTTLQHCFEQSLQEKSCLLKQQKREELACKSEQLWKKVTEIVGA